jgi:hypothetical protein
MDWLLGQPFSRFLKAYGCIPAGNLALSDTQHFANPPFFIPDLYISKENYLINNQTFNSLYFGNLDNDAIAARSVPGGICR